MGTNIVAIICALVALFAGVYVNWIEVGPGKKDDDKDSANKDNDKNKLDKSK